MVSGYKISKDIKSLKSNYASVDRKCSISHLVIREEEGKYYLAAFAFLCTREEATRFLVPRPEYYILADLETGSVVKREDCRENDFSTAPFDRKYSLDTNGKTRHKDEDFYIEAYGYLDEARQILLEAGIGPHFAEAYRKYFGLISGNIPDEYLRFYEELGLSAEAYETAGRKGRDLHGSSDADRRSEKKQQRKNEKPPADVMEAAPAVSAEKPDTDKQRGNGRHASSYVPGLPDDRHHSKDVKPGGASDTETAAGGNAGSIAVAGGQDMSERDTASAASEAGPAEPAYPDTDGFSSDAISDSTDDDDIGETVTISRDILEKKLADARRRAAAHKSSVASAVRHEPEEAPAAQISETEAAPVPRPLARFVAGAVLSSAARVLPVAKLKDAEQEHKPETAAEEVPEETKPAGDGMNPPVPEASGGQVSTAVEEESQAAAPDPSTVRNPDAGDTNDGSPDVMQPASAEEAADDSGESQAPVSNYLYSDVPWRPLENLSILPERYYRIAERIADYIEFLPCNEMQIRFSYPLFCFKKDTVPGNEPWQMMQVKVLNAELGQGRYRVRPSGSIYSSCGHQDRCLFYSCPYLIAAYIKYLKLTDPVELARQRSSYERHKSEVDAEGNPGYIIKQPMREFDAKELRKAKAFIDAGMFGVARKNSSADEFIISYVTDGHSFKPCHGVLRASGRIRAIVSFTVLKDEIENGLTKRGYTVRKNGEPLPDGADVLLYTDYLIRSGKYPERGPDIQHEADGDDMVSVVF